MSDKNKDDLSEKIEELNDTVDLEEKNPKYNNIESDIEKNILIRVMPRKFKTSTGNTHHSNKAVGAVIIIVGILVMVAAVYIGYIYLINPKGSVLSDNIDNTPIVEKNLEDNNIAPIEENIPVKEDEALVIPENTGEWILSTSSTSTIEEASSTVEIISSTSVENLIISANDTDGEGLSDVEEGLLGTDYLKIDTDADGYDDFSELMNFYNPAGVGKLSDNPNLRFYNSTRFAYSVLIPASWNIKDVGQGESAIFSAPDNSFFQIVSEPNLDKKDILSWYNNLFPDEIVTAENIVIKNDWQGIYSKDKNNFYLTDLSKNYVYSLSYVSSEQASGAYKNIFQVFINSFSLVK